MAPFWFANGIVLAVLLRRPTREWPALVGAAAAGFIINMLLAGFPLFPDGAYAVANAVEPLLAATLVRRYSRRFALRSLRSLGVLTGAAVVACAGAATIAWAAGPIRWLLWFVDDLLGMLLVAPAVLVFWPSDRRTPTRFSARSVIEITAIGTGLLVVTLAIFFQLDAASDLHYFDAILPFLLWSALRFRDKGAVVASLLLAVLTIGLTLSGVGPFAAANPPLADRSLAIQIFLAVFMLSHLSLGIILVERGNSFEISRLQVEILERVGAGAPLAEILDRIVRLVERQEEGLFCSILLVDAESNRVRHGAAPNLPSEFNRAIDGVAIGATAGSCGAAAALGQRVIVSDIATHPNWANYKHLALPHGLKACWSSPIFSPAREVLGTFAIYYKESRSPEGHETQWVDAATHLASIAICRDRSEQRLVRSEARLRQLFETTHEGVWILDAKRSTTYINPRMAEIIGRAPDEVLGRDAMDFVYPEDRSLAEANFAVRLEGRSGQHEIRVVHRNGSVRSLLVTASPIFGPEHEVTGFLGMISDITERKAAEMRVAEQAALLDHARDAIVLLGPDHTIRYWNEGAARLYGWSSTEAVGQKITDLVYQDDTETYAAAMRRTIADGAFEGEIVQWTRKGRKLSAEARWSAVVDDAGRTGAILAISTDVTEKKGLESQLILNQRMESLGTLAGGIAHDFNNILTGILGNVRLARRELGAEHAVQPKLATIEQASVRAADLVHQILAFSQRNEPRREGRKLRPVVEEALKLLSASLPPMVSLRTSFSGDEFDVLMNASQLHQVVINLGTNAAHALGEHGGVVEFRLEALTLATALNTASSELAPGRYMRLSVADNGSGMDAGVVSRVFDPFFTTKAPGKGTGLGLSVVLGIVRAHGGGISVASKVGTGSTFHVYLPAGDEDGVARAAPAAAGVVAGRGERIVFVDDEDSIVSLLCTMLDGLGFKARGFTDPVQALEFTRQDPAGFDAVVTDYAMPRFTGLDLARSVRGMRPEVPVVIVSGHLDASVREQAARGGFRDILSKPDFLEELPGVLRRLLDARA